LKFSPSALFLIKNPLNFPTVCGGHIKTSVNIILEDATFMSKVQCAMLSSQIKSLPSIFKTTKISKFFMSSKGTWDEAVLGICIPCSAPISHEAHD
jgi:hypothetical protein